MTTEPGAPRSPRRPVGRAAVVAAGILLGQIVLYGPALVGAKILLPLGCLAEPNKYLPQGPGARKVESPQMVLLDLVTLTEPDRRFAARELEAGRFPLWTPHKYGGVPFTWPAYSPYFFLSALSSSPVILAWVQLLAALVCGFGAFAFCRRVLELGFWPSALAAWCYPLTGWFVLFQGFPACAPVTWLPWICCAADATIRRVRGAPIGLALVTGLVLVSGNVDVAAQVLLVAAVFSLWRIWDVHRRFTFRFLRGRHALGLVASVALGVALAMPYLLPLQEYARSSDRLSRRAGGSEERPPVGLAGLPQIVLPDMYGVHAEKGACPLLLPIEANHLEGPAQAYVGLVFTMLLVPWALLDRQRRSATIFLFGLALLGAAWMLNVPGFVHLMRLPGANMVSHNRLLFATGFALLGLGAIGMESLLRGALQNRRWLWPQAVLLAVLLGWCAYRSAVFPEPLASQFAAKLERKKPDFWIRSKADLDSAQAWFAGRYQRATLLAAAALAAWLLVRARPSLARRAFPVLAGLLVGDLLLYGNGKRILQSPELYYPEIPVLSQIANAPPGRVVGIRALPANLAQAVGLSDIRGFDSMDPARWVRLLALATPKKGPDYRYAAVQWFAPTVEIVPPSSVRFSPVLDMLAVRYAIYRGTPPADLRPRFQSPDYWVLENPSALPRAFVPRQVLTASDEDTLEWLGRPTFDPHATAYVDSTLHLPPDIDGLATIRRETPTRVFVDARMNTPGLVVLADHWHPGWTAYVDGERAEVLRVNYVLRGVLVPAGGTTIEFRYTAPMVRLGRGLALGALTVLIAWALVVWRRRPRERSTAPGPEPPKSVRADAMNA